MLATKEEEHAKQPDFFTDCLGFTFIGGKRNKQKISISRALGLLLVACDCISNTRLEVFSALRQRGKQ